MNNEQNICVFHSTKTFRSRWAANRFIKVNLTKVEKTSENGKIMPFQTEDLDEMK